MMIGTAYGDRCILTPSTKVLLEQTTTLDTVQARSAKLQEITSHLGWHGSLNGMDSEEILKGNPVGSYILRQETFSVDNTHYYMSWIVDKDKCFYEHRPFCLFTDLETNKTGWLHRNGHIDHLDNLDDLIPIMMRHRPKEQCFALNKHATYFLESK